MLSVHAETAYPASAPGARVRLIEFAPFLRECGVSLPVRSTLTDAEYAKVISPGSAAGKAKVLGSAALRLSNRHRVEDGRLFLLHRLRFLFPLPGIDPPGRLDIYDFDDALFVGSTMDGNRNFAWLKREAERWHTYTRRSRLVLAGNSYLASRAMEHCQRVEVVPSCVDPSIQPVRVHEDRETVRIGWIGSQSTVPYLSQLLPLFQTLHDSGRKFELVIVGGGDITSASWARSQAWNKEGESAFLAGLDLGIMPLPDDPWTRGKCGFKLLQYFSAGVPAVASPVGVNREIVGTERGLLASSDQEWLDALDQLIRDVETRRQMGENARRFVEDEFSYQQWAPRLADVLSTL